VSCFVDHLYVFWSTFYAMEHMEKLGLPITIYVCTYAMHACMYACIVAVQLGLLNGPNEGPADPKPHTIDGSPTLLQ